MVAKLHVALLIVTIIAASLQTSLAAPKPSNKELLEHSIAEYLRHDKQLVQELKQLGFDRANFARTKRQTEFEIDPTNDTDQVGQDKPGFFDRAAKFVVELLQRFLRWVNTENS